MKPHNYYFLSNDLFSLKASDYLLNKYSKNMDVLFVGIANPHFFHVLSLVSNSIRVKKIIAIDNNKSQINHFIKIKNIILESENRTQYIENLFKIKLNNQAKIKLDKVKFKNKYVHGATNDNFIELEKFIWNNSKFSKKLFSSEYNLEAKKTSKGLLIKSKTIGGFTEYFATIISCNPNEYNKIPFSASYGTGFLYSEETFKHIKDILSKVNIEVVNKDVSSIYEKIILNNRYFFQFWWTSNLQNPYFKNKKISKMFNDFNIFGSNKEPNFPEINMILLEDKRFNTNNKIEISDSYFRKRSISNHTKSFLKINKYLKGSKNIEIVNMKSWIDEDKGISKLPKTKYILDSEFLKNSNNKKFTTIFIHILLGHNSSIENFVKVVNKSLKCSKNVIILEHKRAKHRKGITIKKMRDIFGNNFFVDIVNENYFKIRNYIFIFKK